MPGLTLPDPDRVAAPLSGRYGLSWSFDAASLLLSKDLGQSFIPAAHCAQARHPRLRGDGVALRPGWHWQVAARPEMARPGAT